MKSAAPEIAPLRFVRRRRFAAGLARLLVFFIFPPCGNASGSIERQMPEATDAGISSVLRYSCSI